MAEALRARALRDAWSRSLANRYPRRDPRLHRRLAKTKAVGLFYFAGHGVQLAWRNYLIPVDADIVNIEELQAARSGREQPDRGHQARRQSDELVILDACRYNPFGGNSRDQKGLSQLDAPPGRCLRMRRRRAIRRSTAKASTDSIPSICCARSRCPKPRSKTCSSACDSACAVARRDCRCRGRAPHSKAISQFVPPTRVKESARTHEIERGIHCRSSSCGNA